MASKGKINSKKVRAAEKKIEEDDDDDFQYYDKGTGGTICDRLLLNNKLRVGIVMFIFAVVLPLLVYTFMFAERKSDSILDLSDIWGTCVLKPEYRVPCLIDRVVTANDCGNIGCCWNRTTEECHHSLPTKYQYFTQSSTNNNLSIIMTPQTELTMFRTKTIKKLKCVIEPITDTHLQIRIRTPTSDEPTYNSSVNLQDTLFNVSVAATPDARFYFEVHRRLQVNETGYGTMLLSTARGPLIASDNFWEVTLQLPKGGVTYGLGRLRLKTGVENPKVFHSNSNNTGSHPILISINSDGETSGIYIRQGGPMEILFFHESNFLVLRSLSNEGFDINLFAGPAPKEVLNQLTDVLGRPKMPPYWALGLHVCRNSIGKVENVTTMMKEFEIFLEAAESMDLPFDSHCIHERLLHDLTYNITDEEDLLAIQTGLEQLHNNSRAFLMSLPSPVAIGTSVAYNTALEQDILVRERADNETAYDGEYEGIPAVYPDWSDPESASWISDRIEGLKDRLGVIDGLVLQDNWPANNKTQRANETMIYLPKRLNGSLSHGTLWWEAVHEGDILHNAIHNKYSLLHTEHVFNAIESNSALLLSASTHPGTGRYAGSHHQSSTEVPAKWSSLKETLTSALGLGLAGIPLASGGTVCGSMADFNHTLADHEALCLKWYLLSVTLPLIRVSSNPPYRDPTSFPSGFIRTAVMQALKLRYALLPFYYTLFSEAVVTGTPVARPMFFEFPHDNITRYMDEQFMLGSAVMVAPVLEPRAISVDIYLPKEPIKWFHFVGGYPINNGTGGHLVTVSTLETEILMLLRSGYIVPIQNVSLTATTSRLLPHHLIVGLDCKMELCSAEGNLFLDSADQTISTTITFSANATSLTVFNLNSTRSFLCNVKQEKMHVSTIISGIDIYGLAHEDFKMSISTGDMPPDVTVIYTKKDSVLRCNSMPIDWCKCNEDEITISWS